MVHRHHTRSQSHRQWEAAILSLGLVALVAGCSCAGPSAPTESGAESQLPTASSDTSARSGGSTGTNDGSGGSTGSGGGSGGSTGTNDGSGGSTGTNDGSGGGSGGSTGTNDGSGGGANPVVYEWGLPSSDISVTGNDGPAYGILRRGCQEGQDFVYSEARFGFSSPRNVVLFAAGIRICFGDIAGGQQYFEHARDAYGLDGLAPEGVAECDLYKSVRSVLEQKPRTDFPCAGGAAPPYRGQYPTLDDPLTLDIDESTNSIGPAPGGETSPLGESPQLPVPSGRLDAMASSLSVA